MFSMKPCIEETLSKYLAAIIIVINGKVIHLFNTVEPGTVQPEFMEQDVQPMGILGWKDCSLSVHNRQCAAVDAPLTALMFVLAGKADFWLLRFSTKPCQSGLN